MVNVRVRELPQNWIIGQRAEVFTETGCKADVLAVPHTCLQWRGGKPGVLVADGGKALWRDVTLGLRGRDSVEVTQGLSSGKRVVTPVNPQQPPLKSGQHITVK